MISQVLLLMCYSFVVLFCLMSFVWWYQDKTKNAGLVDVAWAFSFAICVVVYYLAMSELTIRTDLLILMVCLWSGRLGLYLFLRNWNQPEDARYTNLRKEWGDKANVKLFLFFQFQAALAVLLTLPFILTFLNPTTRFSFVELTGLALWAMGLIGESIADHQLKTFKSNPANKGKLCDVGLWYYSRHPNYFFEWLVWVAYFVYALASPYGWMSIICPLLMYHFLMNVTGVKYTEEHMLATRGEVFKQYQESTSSFFPWFKKHNKAQKQHVVH